MGIEKAGLTYILKLVCEYWKQGIGKSKRNIYLQNNRKSPYVHSWSTFHRYAGIAKDFVNWSKKNGVNRLHQVNYEHIERYIAEKIERGVSHRTVKTNLSALKKFFETAGRSDIAEKITENYQKNYSQARLGGRAIGYSDPERVIEALRKEEHKVLAKLQLLTGARVGDVKKMEIKEEEKKVIIHKSKGGRTREISYKDKYVDRTKEFEEVKRLKEKMDRYIEEKGWKSIRSSYYPDLRNACKKVGEYYSGSHAFRVTYLKERFDNLVENGCPPEEAKRIVAEEAGHSRLQMGDYYRAG